MILRRLGSLIFTSSKTWRVHPNKLKPCRNNQWSAWLVSGITCNRKRQEGSKWVNGKRCRQRVQTSMEQPDASEPPYCTMPTDSPLKNLKTKPLSYPNRIEFESWRAE